VVVELLVGKDILVIDDHAIFFAQVLLQLGDRIVKALMKLLGGIEHGGISQFEIGHSVTPCDIQTGRVFPAIECATSG
jgi:hypothetical protein